MSSRLEKFLALSLAEKGIFVKAWFMLGWMRAGILLSSFRHMSRGLVHHEDQTAGQTLTPEQERCAQRIGYLVSAAAVATPWRSRCLVQALVVQRLLAERQIPGSLFLGARNFEGRFCAHAWLMCGNSVVSGGPGHEHYQELTRYSWGLG